MPRIHTAAVLAYATVFILQFTLTITAVSQTVWSGFARLRYVRTAAFSTRKSIALAMRRRYISRRQALVVALLVSLVLTAAPCKAIVVGHIDNFNDGTTQGWGVGSPGVFPVNQSDLGQSGAGDHALWMATSGAGGTVPNLLVFNTSTNWTGNWTAAGVSRVELDVRDPGANNFPLAIRLGVVGPDGGPFSGGGGDTYVTQSMPVPKDGQWHRLTFDVSPSSFSSTGGADIDDALANVRHFRILHNPALSFSGANTSSGGGEFYLDNIQALSSMIPPVATGDYNENGVVDAADYVLWRNTLDQTVTPAGSGADGNMSGTVDAADYDFWRARFGNLVPIPALAAAVPEPTNIAPLLMGFVLLRFSQRRPSIARRALLG